MKKYDTIVIGAGLSGLMTATLLAQANRRVLLAATGVGALALASGAIDVLGHQPVESRLPLDNPLAALADFLADHPDHPYRHTGPQAIRRGLDALKAIAAGQGLPYIGETEKNLHLPTALGAVHPTALAPQSLAQGDLRRGGRMLLVGFDELRDFYPKLACENLNAQKLGVQAKSVTIPLPTPADGRDNITPIELAAAFDDPAFRRRLVRVLNPHVRGFSRIGFPAVLGLHHHPEALADLETELGKTVFEISTLPPSVPGRRLFEALRNAFLQAGGRLILGGQIIGGQIVEGRVTNLQLKTVSRPKTLSAGQVVLATGGLFGGGLQTDAAGRVWEPLLGLPVTGVESDNRQAWFTPNFLSPQPIAGAGVAVDDRLRPINADGNPLAQNLTVVGGQLAQSNWMAGRTGGGVALATAVVAADGILANG